MGAIAFIESIASVFKRNAWLTEIIADLGGNESNTIIHVSPPGVDAKPLPEDYAYVSPTRKTGEFAAPGYVDTKNEPVAQNGEFRAYARDDSGAPVCQIWTKKDGTILIDNGTAVFEMQPGGDILANGATITKDGDFITAAGNSVDNHFHQGNLGYPTGVSIMSGGGTIPGFLPTTDGVGDIITGTGTSVDLHTHGQGNDSNGDTEQETNPPT